MGKVWRAHDELLNRTVAVKELTAGKYVSEADRAVLHQRTRKEARAAARITHPGVVTVHDVLDHDDRPWIVMQYVDGPSLADAAKEAGRIEAREAARIGLQVLGALRAAHAAGVLHRDVKPGNVLLARDGGVLLTDFGIAAIEGDATITRTGEIVGSIEYLAPERVRGSDPGPASDLWSLGATLYTAVEGTSPFRRESPLSTMQAVVTDEPPAPGHAGTLAPVIAALLCKDPVKRPGAAQAEWMLRDVLEGRALPGAGSADTTRLVGQGGGRDAAPRKPTSFGAPVPVAGQTRATAPTQGAGQAPGAVQGPPTVPGAVPGTPARRSRWRGILVAITVAAVIGGGAGYAALNLGDDESGSPSATDDVTPGGQPSAGRSGAGGPTEESTAGATEAAGTGEESVPEGWQHVTGKEGFSLNVPDGWKRQMNGDNIDYTPDNGDHFIRISIAGPVLDNPYDHMLDMEKGLVRLPAYERIQLEPNTFRGQTNSALWEFSWTETKQHPGPRHAIDQIYYSDDGSTEYAVYMGGPEDDWEVTRQQFDAVLSSWQPPGGKS
jgi:tRNA A-37 threonylcarbamoyl transferase component Bud32